MCAATFREDIPWLYELGMEVYRTPLGSHKRSIAQRRFEAGLRFLQREKIPEDAFLGPDAIRFISREIEEIETRERSMFEGERGRLTEGIEVERD